MKTQPYITPPGTYDLPFTWAFDASAFADGSNAPNSSIYLQGGYGDFQLRRIVGMNRFLAGDGTGKFQIQRASKGSYLQSDPVQALNTPELPITPEESYLETGKIRFDLYGISKPAQPLTAQIAFEGVRRMKGSPPPQPGYANVPKSYTYEVSATLTETAPAAPVSTFTKIVDYDFELHQIIILKSGAAGTAASQEFLTEAGGLSVTANAPGTGGNAISVFFTTLGPSQPVSVAVVGNAITVGLATDAGGFIVDNQTGPLVATMNATPAVAALVTVVNVLNPFAPFNIFPLTFLSGGSGAGSALLSPLTTPVCAMSVYDQNRVTISNIPIMDIFYDGGPGSVYRNGAMVPPLFYRKDSVLQIDFYSEVTDPADLPTEVVVYLVGKKLYPCA